MKRLIGTLLVLASLAAQAESSRDLLHVPAQAPSSPPVTSEAPIFTPVVAQASTVVPTTSQAYSKPSTWKRQNKFLFFLLATAFTASRVFDARQTYTAVSTGVGYEENGLARPLVNYAVKTQRPLDLEIPEFFVGAGLSYFSYRRSGYDPVPLIPTFIGSVLVNVHNASQ